MDLHIVAVGNRMPEWVNTAYLEYSKRLGRDCRVVLHEVKPERRAKHLTIEQIKQRERERIFAALPGDARLGVLDESGKQWTTVALADKLAAWIQDGQALALVIGGADGLHQDVRERAQFVWSLSRLTLPHPLVRIVLIEQIYRAWSITKNHPYHRGET